MRTSVFSIVLAAVVLLGAGFSCTKTVPAKDPSPKMEIAISDLSSDGVRILVNNSGEACYTYKFLAPVKAADVQAATGKDPEKAVLEAWFSDNAAEVGLPCSFAGNKLEAATSYVTAALAIGEDGGILDCKYQIFSTLAGEGMLDGSGNAGNLGKEDLK